MTICQVCLALSITHGVQGRGEHCRTVWSAVWLGLRIASKGGVCPSYGYNRVRSTNCTRATRCSSLLVLEKSTTHQRGVLTYWYWWTRTFYKNKNRCLVLFSSFTLSLWSNVANFQWAKSPKREFPAVSKKFADTEIWAEDSFVTIKPLFLTVPVYIHYPTNKTCSVTFNFSSIQS